MEGDRAKQTVVLFGPIIVFINSSGVVLIYFISFNEVEESVIDSESTKQPKEETVDEQPKPIDTEKKVEGTKNNIVIFSTFASLMGRNPLTEMKV